GLVLGAGSVAALRHELTGLDQTSVVRPAAPETPPAGPASPGEGEAVLATWHHLLDAGRLQDGEPFLAGTAPRARARISAGTAAALGIDEHGAVTVATDRGSLTLPVTLTPMHDRVVWIPT